MKKNNDRQQAIQEGRTTYEGRPCKNCGTTLKNVSDWGCVECNKQRAKRMQSERRVDGRNKEVRQRYEQGEAGKAARKRWNDSDAGLRATRKAMLKHKFGMTLEQYDGLLTSQDHSCKICGTHIDDNSRHLAVDHNHETGEIRALLCDPCNKALGFLKEDINIMQNMIDYVKEYN